MNAPLCGHCGARVDAATLCRGCIKTLAWALANIAAYLGDLDVIRTRRTRFADPAPLRHGGGPIPLPVDARFTDIPGGRCEDGRIVETWGRGSELAWVARNTLTGWVRHLLEHHPQLPGPRDTPDSCCAWLLTHADRIRVDEAGPELLDELCDLERQLRRFVDRPPDRWYAGPCTAGLSGLAGTWLCGNDLYAVRGDTEVTCRDCNTTYEIEQRRAWLLTHAEDEWHTAADLARAVTALGEYERGERRLVVRIGQWANAEPPRLQTRGHREIQGRARPLYRLGDVLDLVYEDARRSDERSA